MDYGGHDFAADTGFAPWNQSNLNLRDDVSKTIGKHTLHFGFDGTFVQQNELSGVTGANSGDQQGLLTFHPVATSAFLRSRQRVVGIPIGRDKAQWKRRSPLESLKRIMIVAMRCDIENLNDG
jgi:hypothetical protein